MSVPLKAALSLLLLFTGLYGGITLVRLYRELERDSVYIPPRQVKGIDELSFIDSSGQTFKPADMKGKVWVASFFFSNCPGFCTQLNQRIASLEKELADVDVTFVSFSVDPTNDTPERLQETAAKYQANPQRWKFVVGAIEETQDLGQGAFKLLVAGTNHTDRLVLIDRDANFKTYQYNDSTQIEAFKRDARKVAAAPKADQL